MDGIDLCCVVRMTQVDSCWVDAVTDLYIVAVRHESSKDCVLFSTVILRSMHVEIHSGHVHLRNLSCMRCLCGSRRLAQSNYPGVAHL